MTLKEFVDLYSNERDQLALKKLRREPMSLTEKERLKELNKIFSSVLDETSTERQIKILQDFLNSVEDKVNEEFIGDKADEDY